MKSTQNSDSSRKGNDVGNDFFVVGTPLHSARSSYVRRPADELFFESLLAGRYTHVIAPDQSGKTSLIATASERLRNNGVQVAVLDLAQLGLRDAGTDAGRFYYSIAYRILRQLRIKFDLQSWWQDKALLSNRQRFHEFYSEVVLGQTKNPVVIVVDEIQCVEQLPFSDQLLTSVRSAHDARTTDPDFSRLAFALCGECDPAALVEVPEFSPFQVTQSIPLRDFTREEIELFASELNLSREDASTALDRIYHWTNGQPYLTQKLARAVSRETPDCDVEEYVDVIVARQFTHRASINNEPLLNHVQRRVLDDSRREQLLNLYGRIRKGVEVVTDLGAPLQRRLIALGLLSINERGDLAIRNRIYADVFTARWANENISINWRVPAVVTAVLLTFLLIPFWYTQWLPRPYVATLIDPSSDLENAASVWTNLRSFPGHTDTADKLYRLYLLEKGRLAQTRSEIGAVSLAAERFESGSDLARQLVSGFHDREVRAAIRVEDRDTALLAALEGLLHATPERRRQAAALIGADYPTLLASMVQPPTAQRVFNSDALTVSDIDASAVRQWSLAQGGIRSVEPWQITALEVSPLVRRVIVDQQGEVRRASLTLNLRHGRHSDLRIKLIAPSGKTVEIETGLERSSVVDDIRLLPSQLEELIGESLSGTWVISIRDEEVGVAGHLGGWNLTLNSQGLVEDFQRGVDIPDPVEVEATDIWVSHDGRYAVARATQSDSARIWDLAFGKPIRAVALNQSESIIGLDAGARRLVTGTIDSVNLWDTGTGDRVSTMPVAGAGLTGQLSRDGEHLFVAYPGDAETRFELWSLESMQRVAELAAAGTPALVSLDASGRRLAVADFDRSVRIWNFRDATLVAQLNLSAQPSDILLSPGGESIGAVYGRSGMSVWSLEAEGRLLFETLESGNWQMAFSPSGVSVIAGRPATGFQVYDTRTGISVGPPIGLGSPILGLLAFSRDEKTIVTGGPKDAVRFWRAPSTGLASVLIRPSHAFWLPSPGVPVTASHDARKLLIGDRDGHLHILRRNADPTELASAAQSEVSYIGHRARIELIAVDPGNLWAATVAEDRTLRAWGLADGQPQPWVAELRFAPDSVEFSPDARLIAVLGEAGLAVFDRQTGEQVYDYPDSGGFTSMAFASKDAIQLGTADGELVMLRLQPGMPADTRRIWQGKAAITHLARGPRANSLIVVGADNIARLLSLEDGTVAPQVLELPAPVREVAIAPIGARVLFRTERWVHKTVISPDGFTWEGGTLIEPVGGDRRIVFDGAPGTSGRPGGPLLVATGNSGLVLRELDGDPDAPGLFGSRDELLAEWRLRLGDRGDDL